LEEGSNLPSWLPALLLEPLWQEQAWQRSALTLLPNLSDRSFPKAVARSELLLQLAWPQQVLQRLPVRNQLLQQSLSLKQVFL
jgi:hypothetical protein